MTNVSDGQRDLTELAAARTLSWLVLLGVDVGEPGLPDPAGGEAAPNTRDMLEGVRQDADAFAFARRLLEAVMSASDPFAAALGLRDVTRDVPQSMPMVERFAVRAGGYASLGLPWAVLPVARKWLRERVSHLVMSVKMPLTDTGPDMTAVASALRSSNTNTPVTLALHSLEVAGDAAADAELQKLVALASLDEVQHLTVDASRLVAAGVSGEWALDHDVEVGADRLRTLIEAAMQRGTEIMLEPSDYRSALLAPQLLVKALSQPGLKAARVGVMLPTELPESLQAAQALIQFSRVRVNGGGEPLEIGIGPCGIAAREQIRSILSGHAVPTIDGHAQQQAQWLRMLQTALTAAGAVRVTAASESPHLLAAATVMAERTDGRHHLTLQLRAGVAPELEAAIHEHGFAVRSRLPLVAATEFGAAASYLIALAAETANPDSTLVHARALLAGEPTEHALGVARLGEALRLAQEAPPSSHRVQNRAAEWSDEARDTVAYYRAPTEMHKLETAGLTAAVLGLTRANTGAITMEVLSEMLQVPAISATGFANEPHTDASRFDNREWVRRVLSRARRSDIGMAWVHRAGELGALQLGGAAHRDALFTNIHDMSQTWRELRAAERGAQIAKLALRTAAARDRLLEVLAAEAGAPVHVIDADISGAIDAARYLGQQAGGLAAVRGATFVPDQITLVVADAGVPLAERAEAVLAALAAGSAVVVVAHASIARSSGVLIEEWEAAGLPTGAVTMLVAPLQADAQAGTGAQGSGDPHLELASALAIDLRVDRALMLGARSTARALLRRRPDLQVHGRFRAPGVTVVSASADPQQAARHIIASAFGGGAADATTSRAVVLLGAAARSRDLRRALADGVASLRVGNSARPKRQDALAFSIGPLPAPPSVAGLRALTQLDAGERWLVKPERLDKRGLLWRPGIRLGVHRDSTFWQDSVGMPVIGVVHAHTVDEAIALTNTIGEGGVAALEANEPSEILPWLERVRSAAVSLGRPTTGARIERQPGGGWREAAMGPTVLAGGPNRLFTLGSWQVREGTASSTLHLRGLRPEVRLLIEVAQASLDYPNFDRVRRAALSDTLTWRTSLGKVEDVSGLGVERNLLRRRPVGSHVRLAEGAPVAELVRVVCAGLVVGAPLTVSTGVVLPPEVSEFLALQGITVSLERDDAWLERVSVSGPGDGETPASRVRLIGGDRVRAAEWLGGLGSVSLWADAVTMAGPVELLAFVREQSVAIRAHRHDLAMLPAGIGGWIAELQGRE